MRNKKEFSFDEEKDAELIISKGFPNNIIDYSRMYLIAKYFRKKFKYGEIRLEKELIRFCKKQDANFNPVAEAAAIHKWVKSAMNYELRKIDDITISQKDIAFLKNIENPKDRKILFTILALSKALKKRSIRKRKQNMKPSGNYYIHYSNFLDIIHLSKLNNITEVDLADLLHKYKNCFDFYNPERELIRINYINNDLQGEITLSSLENLSNYYEALFGNNKGTLICPICGREVIKTNNNQKRCKQCSKEIRNNRQKELMRKKRSLLAV